MKEKSSQPDQSPQKFVRGNMIFDANGTCIGLAVRDGSLDLETREEKKNIVVVIRPPKRKD